MYISPFKSVIPDPDKPVGVKRKSRFIGKLKIEECPPPAEIFVDVAFSRRSHRLLWRSLLAPSFLKWIRRRRTLNIQYSIGNIQLFVAHKTAPLAGLNAVLVDVFFLMTLRAVIHFHAIP